MGKRRRPGDDACVRLVTEWARFIGSWEGTASEMHEELQYHHDWTADLPASMPKLSAALRRNNVALAKAGVCVSYGHRETGTGRKLMRIGVTQALDDLRRP